MERTIAENLKRDLAAWFAIIDQRVNAGGDEQLRARLVILQNEIARRRKAAGAGTRNDDVRLIREMIDERKLERLILDIHRELGQIVSEGDQDPGRGDE